MRIRELITENFKRVKMVRIRPDGNMVFISGRNKQGKTSILDSIKAVSSKSSFLIAEPSRRINSD